MRTKSTQEAKTAKKAMFMIERCLSVGDTGGSRSGGEGGVLPYICLKAMCRPQTVWFFSRFGFRGCGECICRFNSK